MRILVYDLGNLVGVFDIFQVIEGFVVALFWQVMDDDHFDVAFFIGKVDEILDTAMRHHDQVYEILVYDVEVVFEDFFEISLFLPEFVLGFNAFLALIVAFLTF